MDPSRAPLSLPLHSGCDLAHLPCLRVCVRVRACACVCVHVYESEGCRIKPKVYYFSGSPGGSVVKNLPVSAGDIGDLGSTPGSGRSPRERNGNPLQYSCLGNPMNRRAWWATVHGVIKELDMTEHLTDTHTHNVNTDEYK